MVEALREDHAAALMEGSLAWSWTSQRWEKQRSNEDMWL